MSVTVVIQAKALEILESEAAFYDVTPTALAKAIMSKVIAGGLTRDVLQGVDVGSYQIRRRGRPSEHHVKEKRGRKPKFTLHGEPVSLAHLSAKTGIPRSTIWRRMKVGQSLEQAIGEIAQ
jgi:hypothetical protein